MYEVTNIDEEGVPTLDSQWTVKFLKLYYGIFYWFVLSCGLLFGLSMQHHKSDMQTTMNMIYNLDLKLKQMFLQDQIQFLRQSSKRISQNERIVRFCSLFPLVIPVCLGCTFFHPDDPFHILAEYILEVDVTSGWTCMLLVLLVVWGTLSFSSIIMAHIMLAISFVLPAIFWLDSVTSYTLTGYRENRQKFEIAELEPVPIRKVILIQKYLQVLASWVNCSTANFEIACHPGITLIIAVLGSFALVRNYKEM